MLWEFVLLVTTFALVYLRISSTRKDRKKIWLNGPIHLPIIGGGLSVAPLGITSSFNDTFTKICTKYGPFCGLFAGQNYFVFVSDPKIAKKILSSEEFSSRFPPYSWDSNLYGGPNLGVLHSYGQQANKVRFRSISRLKIYGTDRGKWMNSVVQEQAKLLLEQWDDKISGKNTEIKMKGAFSMTVINIVFKILTGETIKDEKRIGKLVNMADNIFAENAKSVALLFAFPFLRFIPHLTIYQQAQFVWNDIKKIFQEVIQKKRTEGSYKENPADFIDSFLYDQEYDSKSFSDEEIVWICVDIFLAAITSLTAIHLEWAILFITSNSQLYQNVIKDIDCVIGRNKVPDSQDKTKMPYVEAFLLETLRLGNVVNFGMRCPLKDIQIEGYHIPKNAQVMIENECLKRDHEVWGVAKNFQPERFLSSDRNVINTEKLKAFGIKRTCLGEAITKCTSFILFTSLLQRYTLRRSATSTNASFVSASGIMGRPQPYSIQAEFREK